ncbi:MAG: ABC transporter permease [Planctomycetota bacterium]|jgi:ABC-type transport system involved in multi-copper enzyme maturation permease subunit
MSRILVIAGNTFREVIRDRIFYILIFFAILLIVLSKALGWISIEHDERVITNLSLAAVHIFALMITVFLGTNLVYKEVEKRTLYSVLAKDVRRWQFLLGKYFGLLGTAYLCVAGMGIIFFAYLLVMGGLPTGMMVLALYGILLELMLITSISLLFSSVTSPVLSAFITFALFLTGHSMEVVRKFVKELEFDAPDPLLTFAYYVLPNLENFNFKNFVGAPNGPALEHVLLSTGYAVFYTAILIAITLVIYRKKDF